MKSFVYETNRPAKSNTITNNGSGKSMPAVAIQKKGSPEEEPVQGKLITQKQSAPEEEPLQKKTTQLAATEEELPVQKKDGEEEPLQKKTTQLAAAEEELPVQKKDAEEEPLQKKAIQLAATEEELPVQKKSNNTGLPDNLKSGVEALSGHSMDDVKVHYGSAKPAQLNAYAYAQGTDIHVAPGQERHLPHEAWHVAQQKQGRVQPTMQMKQGVAVNDDPGLESEADVMGAKAVQTTEAAASNGMLSNKAISTPVVQGKWLSAINYINTNNANPSEVYNEIRKDPFKALASFAESDSNIEVLKKLISTYQGSLDVVQVSLLKLYESDTVYSNSGLVQALGNIFTPNTAGEETNEEDHPDVSDAPEYYVDPNEDVYKLDLNNKDHELMERIFLNWLKSKGYPIDDTTRTKYYQWLFGGVYTRGQFEKLFNPGSTSQLKKTTQLARTPNTVSEQPNYITKNFGPFNNVKYLRDGVGNIPFHTTHNAPTLWQNPVKPSSGVDLKTDSKNSRFGIMPSGLKVEIAKASRSQHFAIGDRLLPGNGRAGAWTWHHLSKEYEMVLVDMTVHAKHGHNGGVYLWT